MHGTGMLGTVMRILIVDDERPARDKLRRLLARHAGTDGGKHSGGISALEEAADGFEALARIASFQPDAVFLDIAMPELTGLELAASLPEPAPLLVFATAWDRYAVEAFDAGAIDYLLKPYDEARLARALARLHERMRERLAVRAGSAPPAEPAAPTVPHVPAHPLRQLLVAERGGSRVVPVADIQWIATADNYVVLHTADGSPLLRQTLAGLLPRLGPGFVRCHRRAAVQSKWIARVLARDKGDCDLLLHGGAHVPCSRQYRETLLQQIRQPPQTSQEQEQEQEQKTATLLPPFLSR
jgi:two-component system LytT family response regulator